MSTLGERLNGDFINLDCIIIIVEGAMRQNNKLVMLSVRCLSDPLSIGYMGLDLEQKPLLQIRDLEFLFVLGSLSHENG